MEILVTNGINSIKRNESKRIVGHIFVWFIALVPSSPSLAGLDDWLCWPIDWLYWLYWLDLVCYKNLSNPNCIDLILINAPQKYQSTCVLETGLSDFHLMTVKFIRRIFKKLKPGTISYRS